MLSVVSLEGGFSAQGPNSLAANQLNKLHSVGHMRP
jgi:hypothetical protein